MFESVVLVIFTFMLLFSVFEDKLSICYAIRSPLISSLIRCTNKCVCDLPAKVDFKLSSANKVDILFILSITGRCPLIFFRMGRNKMRFVKKNQVWPDLLIFLSVPCGKAITLLQHLDRKSQSHISFLYF